MLLFAAGCGAGSSAVTPASPPGTVSPPPSDARRPVRATGTIQAVRFYGVLVPQVSGQGGRLTLTRLIPNGSKVKEGDLLAEFDRTQQLDNAREAQAKYDDLTHQVEQRKAQNRADAEKRAADLQKAEADVAKARLQLQKAPLLSEIDKLKADVKLENALAHVSSLNQSNPAHDRADAAALRIVELQRDRQKVTLERTLNNASKLEIRAPLAGMIAHDNVWRNGSMGHAQEGDQLWSGQPLLRIFDPSDMEVRTMVGEPDGAALVPGCRAVVRVDAYPDLELPARLESASPAAASALGSPIKTFSARFRLERTDPHLLPDLSAAVIIEPPEAGTANGAR
jgi:multidrug efflux pump subunit AcrA (membrane-fusion protein)